MSEINAESTTMPPVELRMPRASEREEMLAGKLYNSVDPELNGLSLFGVGEWVGGVVVLVG